ncbi:hypothetical protein C8J57DRAFT_1219542 [Mycena rebaudengoi]|nr:hypothetical protein C8J57DRAFT_1219542 [Mycena rebaudengoi]
MHDFRMSGVLPLYNPAELSELRYWVGHLMTHFVFRMFQYMAFLCHFIGYTHYPGHTESLHPKLLIPLMDSAWNSIVALRCPTEYSQYDDVGRLRSPGLQSSANLVVYPQVLHDLFSEYSSMNSDVSVSGPDPGMPVPVCPTPLVRAAVMSRSLLASSSSIFLKPGVICDLIFPVVFALEE